MKNNTYIWAGAGIGITILIAYLCTAPSHSKIKAKQDETDNYSSPDDKEKVKDARQADQDNNTWMLIKGSAGKEVERLQIWLLRNHGWKGPVTGIYDEQTDRLVKKRFGKDHVDQATYIKYKMGIPIHEQIKNAQQWQKKEI